MRLITTFLAVATLFLAVSAPRAEDAAGETAIREIISRQMSAFQRDDGIEAFSYAAPHIRRMFGTVENFMAMVRGGYAPVYRPRDVKFGALVQRDGVPTQEVIVVGPDGHTYRAHYEMRVMPDGSWRIGGVYLEKLPELSV